MFLNWTDDIVQGLVRFRIQGGLDVWRKLCNKYIPLIEDSQIIFIRQVMSIKPVIEMKLTDFSTRPRGYENFILRMIASKKLCVKDW